MHASFSPGNCAADEDHLLFYKIVSDADGIRLRIWESATDLDQSPAPYLYILNLRVGSMAEAKKRLKAHLALNGGTLATSQALPHKGQVRLMAHATWNGTED
ncbi:MAG: hypothetical protein DCF17_11645 [Shackletoniella antarctica]|uniref:Uncharacterized protein n=1 Tax=Shackletoniella antarctica TaxID=268115 RepID=A0A2W4WFL9_9CYAN|nr:MAG: hypothetical protein DCF17_11645 [Shackletoniella antarctica]